jgi:hypothetical protein
VTRPNYVDVLAEAVPPPPPPPRPLACEAYLLLPERELATLMRAQSLDALELTRRCHLEVPHANH